MKRFLHLINIICLLVAIVYIFDHYDTETAANTTVITSAIKNVEHIKGSKSAGFISFTADNEEYICVIQNAASYVNRREKVQRVLSEFEAAERNGSLLTIVSTDEQLEILPQKSVGKTWAVGVSNGQTVLCSLDKHNSDQLITKIIFLIVWVIWLLITCAYFYINRFFGKPHKRIKR